MKIVPYAIAAALLTGFAGCSKESSVETGNASSLLKTMNIYLEGNNVAAGDDTLTSITYFYDDQKRLVQINDTSYNKDGARLSGSMVYTYTGTAQYPAAANGAQEDDNGVMQRESIVFRFNSAGKLAYDSSLVSGNAAAYAWTNNIVIRTVSYTSTPANNTIDTSYFDDRMNIVKQTATQVIAGDSIRIVAAYTPAAYANPLAAYPYPPVTDIESARVPLSAVISGTPTSGGPALYTQTINYFYTLDERGRVATQTGATGGKITYTYY